MNPKKPANSEEIERLRKQIRIRHEDAGTLCDFASVTIRYIYHLYPGCYFERRTGSRYEWDLLPGKCVSLYLSRGRYSLSGKVIISLRVPILVLRSRSKLDVRPGRLPYLSRITVTSPSEFKDALDAIYYASQHQQ